MDATRICCARRERHQIDNKLIGFPDVGAGVRADYGLLTLTALKKLWDGVSGYLG